MHESARSLMSSERSVAEARRLFQRTLSAWVCDLLDLRRRGLDQPGWVRIEDDSQRREAA